MGDRRRALRWKGGHGVDVGSASLPEQDQVGKPPDIRDNLSRNDVGRPCKFDPGPEQLERNRL